MGKHVRVRPTESAEIESENAERCDVYGGDYILEKINAVDKSSQDFPIPEGEEVLMHLTRDTYEECDAEEAGKECDFYSMDFQVGNYFMSHMRVVYDEWDWEKPKDEHEVISFESDVSMDRIFMGRFFTPDHLLALERTMYTGIGESTKMLFVSSSSDISTARSPQDGKLLLLGSVFEFVWRKVGGTGTSQRK